MNRFIVLFVCQGFLVFGQTTSPEHQLQTQNVPKLSLNFPSTAVEHCSIPLTEVTPSVNGSMVIIKPDQARMAPMPHLQVPAPSCSSKATKVTKQQNKKD